MTVNVGSAISRTEADPKLRAYLALVDTTQLRKKIGAYERRSRTERAAKEIQREIYAVLMPPHSNSFALPTYTKALEPGLRLHRCRSLPDVNLFSEMRDAWEAPTPIVGRGRLNAPNEPLIYTATTGKNTAIFEARIHEGEPFAMIEYEVVEPIALVRIEGGMNFSGLNDKEVRKLGMIFQFLEDAFTQKAGPAESHVYIAPEVITKDLFDWPSEVAQGWGYRSVVAPGGTGYNACFRPDQAHRLLRVREVEISTCTQINETTISFDRDRVLRPSPDGEELDVVWSAPSV